ncbi:hypothetical protein D3C71_1394520 [compost metagenome]
MVGIQALEAHLRRATHLLGTQFAIAVEVGDAYPFRRRELAIALRAEHRLHFLHRYPVVVVGIEDAEECVPVVLITADPAIAVTIEQGKAVCGGSGQFLCRCGTCGDSAGEKEQGKAGRGHHHSHLQSGCGGRGVASAASVRRAADPDNGKFPHSRQ